MSDPSSTGKDHSEAPTASEVREHFDHDGPVVVIDAHRRSTAAWVRERWDAHVYGAEATVWAPHYVAIAASEKAYDKIRKESPDHWLVEARKAVVADGGTDSTGSEHVECPKCGGDGLVRHGCTQEECPICDGGGSIPADHWRVEDDGLRADGSGEPGSGRPEELEELLRESGRCLREAYELAEDAPVEQRIKSAHGAVSGAVHELNREDDSGE